MSFFDLFRSQTHHAKSKRQDHVKSEELCQFLHWSVKIIRRRGRRTLTLELKPNSPIVVRTNLKTPKTEILSVLQKKQSWIEKNLQKLNEHSEAKNIRLSKGESLLFLGESFEVFHSVTTLKQPFLNRTKDQSKKIQLLLPVSISHQDLTAQQIRFLVRQFYMREGKAFLLARTQQLALQIGLKPSVVRVRFMSSRWGSCTAQVKISLNARIMSAPLWVIDSVIIHELCHLRHLNHSAAFWKLVDQHAPKHKAADAWLHDFVP